MRPEPRALCDNCRRNMAKVGRPFCTGCYRLGAKQRCIPGLALPAKPAALVDTGLRIDDENAELVHQDGRRQWPVPGHVIYECWVEADPDQPNLLRVLRAAPLRNLKEPS